MSIMSGDEIPDELKPFRPHLSARFFEMRERVLDFVFSVVQPAKERYARELKTNEQAAVAQGLHPLKAREPAVLSELRQAAKERGLYNFFLPTVCGLSVLEYAPIAEILGIFRLANQAMNCAAPDTGNMEVLEQFGTPEQKAQWLDPLLAGEIRSCFAMTEPGVASSDASQISCRIDRSADGESYVINGHKWYISGAMRPECKVAILLGKTSFDGPVHRRQSMILVPMDSPGITILRPLAVFGHEHDHAEIIFDNVVVPKKNMVLGEGRGFDIAQARLGPGRIHHCMRTIGLAEAALSAMVHRAHNRSAFGSLLAEKDTIRQVIARARIEITKCRSLCYLAAFMADTVGFKAARKYISMIKIEAPRMALKVVDEAIQMHGAHGVSQDSRLGAMYTGLRTLRVADGPDVVHLNTVAKVEMNRPPSILGQAVSGTNKNIAKYGKFEHLEERARM
eukprot:INCI18801.1.p1 GENE.INCI18801.1~~INCI18801.1.p1  ORF type:complete len:452 (-),score=66.68 INCI18801.1:885-2240(-)